MKYWIGLLLIALLLLVFLTSASVIERFSASAQTAFVETERTIRPLNSIYVNPGLATTAVNQAMNTNDGSIIDYALRFQEDPMNQFRSKDEQTCRLARHPSQLDRATMAPTGCGWWFVPDGLSIGTLGTITGPADNQVPIQHPTGTWYWNLNEAARMEDIKLCKRITLCEAVTPECGWCDSQGHAVPVNSDGSVKYPTDDSGSCNTRPFTGGTCPAPPAPPSEPILDTNGNVVGEKTPPAPVSICAPRNGKLTRECLVALAMSRGCTPSGSLHIMIARGSSPTESDRVAMDILSKANVVTLTPDLYGNGSLSVGTALTAYTSLTNAMVSGQTNLIRQAARYLAVGGEEINLCDVGENEMGPFSPECLGRAFREVGCQASGAKYPLTNAAATGYTWGTIKNSYRTLASSMFSTDAFVQADAIKDCIGTSYNIFTQV